MNVIECILHTIYTYINYITYILMLLALYIGIRFDSFENLLYYFPYFAKHNCFR